MVYENYENNAESTPVVPTKKTPIVRYAIIGIIAVVALALVISIISALVPGKFAIREANSIDWALSDDDELVFVFNGKKTVAIPDDITEDIDSEYGYYFATDYNQKYAVFTAGKDNDLYVVNSKKYVKVADEVTDYQLSAFGDTMLYVSDGDLYFAELSKPTKAKKIDSDVTGISTMSPDGKSFAYYNYDEEDDEYTCFVSKTAKKGEKKSKATSIFEVSNGAKYVYYKTEEKVSVNDTKLCNVEDWSGSYCLNRDGSQIVFSAKTTKGEVKTYLSNKGGEKVSIGDGSFNSVLAPSGATRYYTCNVASFAKCAISVYDSEDSENVYYYLKNVKSTGEKISALKGVAAVQLLDDAKTVIFVRKGDLRTTVISKPNADAKVYAGFEEDVMTFDATADGEYLYVLDEDSTLYFVKSLKKAAKVDEDVEGFIVMSDGTIYFSNDDDEMFVGKKTSKPKMITDDFSGVDYNTLANVFAVHSDDRYCIVNGKKLKKLFDLKG